MKRALTLSLLFICLGSLTSCYALEWRKLHEEADRMDLTEALAATEKKVDSIDNLYMLGLIYLNLHKDKEAGSTFEKILNLAPQTIEAQWGLAEVLRRQHKASDSERILNEVIKSRADFYPAYITLAYLRYNEMKFEKSVELALLVMKPGQDKVDLSNYVRAVLLYAGNKGMIAHYGGPLSKVINGTVVLPNLKKAQSLQPDYAGVLFGLGSFYFLAPSLAGGDLDRAKVYLERAIKADPLFADAYVRLAQVYKKKGDNNNYAYYLDKALGIDPQNELALDIKSGRCKYICIAGQE
jgi:Tfp pilus assembly protein PilF